jgi:hypothetical protein
MQATPLLAHNPCFKQFLEEGFEMEYSEEEMGPFVDLHVRVTHNGAALAHAHFTWQTYALIPQDVHVESSVRRKGLAGAMYDFAEAFYGFRVDQFWDKDQNSKEAQAFWQTRKSKPMVTPFVR